MKNDAASIAERFWGRVDRSDASGCWPYRGSTFRKGYGQVRALGERMAHRLAYKLTIGPIPVGLTLDHTCRNRICVNPKHLDPVTIQENIRRARKSHCSRGHEFTAENTTLAGNWRSCRTCNRVRKRAWHVAHYVPRSSKNRG
jgi:hypothetical protein